MVRKFQKFSIPVGVAGRLRRLRLPGVWSVVEGIIDPSTPLWGVEADVEKLEASMIYRVRSKTARATQRNTDSKETKKSEFQVAGL